MFSLTVLLLCLTGQVVSGLRFSPSATLKPGQATTLKCEADGFERDVYIRAPNGKIYPSTDIFKRIATAHVDSVSEKDKGPWMCRSGSNPGLIITATISLQGDGASSSAHSSSARSQSSSSARSQSSSSARSRSSFSARSRSSSSSSARSRSSSSARSRSSSLARSRSSSSNTVSSRISYSGPSELGQDIELDCIVTGPVGTTTTWKKGGLGLLTSSRIESRVENRKDGNHSILLIHNSIEADAGYYKCEVQNNGVLQGTTVLVSFKGDGASSSAHSSSARSRSSFSARSRSSSSARSRSSSSARSRSSSSARSRSSSLARSRSSSSNTVSSRISYSGPSELGQDIELDCIVTGPVGTTTTWKKGGLGLLTSSRIESRIENRKDGNHSILLIHNSIEADAGYYKCEVQNNGVLQGTTVLVSFKGIPYDGVIKPRPPVPVERPSNGENLAARLTYSGLTKAGEKLVLDCLVTKPSAATVELTKDGQVLSSTSDRELKWENLDDGEHLIYTIKTLLRSDSGRYRCEVKGQSGSLARSEKRIYVRRNFSFLRFTF